MRYNYHFKLKLSLRKCKRSSNWSAMLVCIVLSFFTFNVNTGVSASQIQQNADVQVSGPPAERTWQNLPSEPLPALPGTEPPPQHYSDLDPETLQHMKQQPFVPMVSPPYTVERDPAVKGPPPPLGQVQVLAPILVSSGEGIDNGGHPLGGPYRPADPDIAIGPNHILTVVNSTFVIYNKAGVELQRTSLAAWFNNVCFGCSPFDPRVAYDPQAGRFIMIALARNTTSQTSNYLLSISQSSDPTGAWWNYSLNGRLDYGGTEPTWADYEDIGFDGIPAASGGAIYVTSNQFTFADIPAFRTAVLLILPKSALYSGSSFSYWRAWDRLNADGSQAFTLRASKTFGNPGGEFLINTKNNGNFVSLWRVNPTYPPTPVDWTLQATIPIGSYSPPPDANQLGCTSVLDTIDNRIIMPSGVMEGFTRRSHKHTTSGAAR
jgi:hypothetical protein